MTARAVVIGDPIAHSLSPVIHGHWLKRYGIAGEYLRARVPAEELGTFLTTLHPRGITGANVTVPHKEAALRHVDRLHESAVGIGAVNTLWFEEDGLVGANSDVTGFLAHLDAAAPDWQERTQRAVVLGAGGAARAIVHGLRSRGVPLAIVNRGEARARSLAAALAPEAPVHGWEDAGIALDGADLLVNTTSLGMTGAPPLNLDLGPLAPGAIVYDIVFAPLETALLAAARASGRQAVDGLGMLLHQATLGFSRWFGRMPEVDERLRGAVLDALANRT
jgi:shikimate dehydrogenase